MYERARAAPVDVAQGCGAVERRRQTQVLRGRRRQSARRHEPGQNDRDERQTDRPPAHADFVPTAP